MSDLRNTLPEEDQYQLLAAHGLREAFCGYWVERDDLDELAELLGLEPRSRRDLTLAEAAITMTDSSDIYESNSVWIGPHGPGWSVVISQLGLETVPDGVIPGDRRLLEVSWMWDIHGLHDLHYCQDDKLIAEIPAFPTGELLPDPVFEPYSHGLPRDGDENEGEERLAHAFLTIVGRITGRFLDEAWFRTPGHAYDLPPINTRR
ncbi:hypothetical protein [Planobispora rosea]|uniref:hypothetical protein n=1 Tax=Planobispora rosea TaxID=35762 RepID=UPI00083B1109|nr:hypothetical protein [Planobispora rosea]